jgi:oligopeptide transport system substrate-binding protein
MAIDRRFITERLERAGQTPTTAFVPPDISGYLPGASAHPRAAWAEWSTTQRQAEARRLLAAAGYGPAHALRLTLKTSNSPGALTNAQSIQADLKAVGVDVAFIQEDGIVIFQSFEIRDFQLGLAGWVADYNDPMTFLALMRSDTGLQNYGDYKNRAYDAWLDKADFEPDAKLRADDLAHAEQLMLDDADIAPIQVGVNLNLVNPAISGWVDNDADVHPIRDLCRNAAPAATSERAAKPGG